MSWVKLIDVLEVLGELADRYEPSTLAQGDIDALAIDALQALADTTEQPVERERSEQDRKDAERYRFIRTAPDKRRPGCQLCTMQHYKEEKLDAAIDAAIRARGTP